MSFNGKFFLLAGLLVGITTATFAGSIPVANHSFETPYIDPNENPFMAISYAPMWIELDLDQYSRNTGTFLNPEPNSPDDDHIVNADGRQLAFLGSQQGNAFMQDPNDGIYRVGGSYRLTVGVCPSKRHPPSQSTPIDTLTLALYYLDTDGVTPIDIATAIVPATALIFNELVDFSLTSDTVQWADPWAGKKIGIAIRATGQAGGFWDLDNVRLTESFTPDFSEDGIVNYLDLAMLAQEWQTCGAMVTDLTGDGCVTLADLAFFADFWLAVAWQ